MKNTSAHSAIWNIRNFSASSFKWNDSSAAILNSLFLSFLLSWQESTIELFPLPLVPPIVALSSVYFFFLWLGIIFEEPVAEFAHITPFWTNSSTQDSNIWYLKTNKIKITQQSYQTAGWLPLYSNLASSTGRSILRHKSNLSRNAFAFYSHFRSWKST